MTPGKVHHSPLVPYAIKQIDNWKKKSVNTFGHYFKTQYHLNRVRDAN
ncbi:hypothetical protein PR048_026268 [Dryococelus australis]|uniref:Uncharacterized protein n=1 Tax=Dryococelus australis TaxID=614101 RepID=A0ABQ9GKV1_9NEOP|nr:hypothetical protein PR048_026268 [Dryococelus australis]